MFGHVYELIIILAIGLIIFGPEKLPEVAANAGKMVREFRDLVDTAMNPHDTQVPEDFSEYYNESLARAGEDIPATDEDLSPEPDPEGFYHFELDEESPDDTAEMTTPDDIDSSVYPVEAAAGVEDENIDSEPAPPHHA